MTGRKIILPALALILGFMIFMLSGCGALRGLALPSPPVFPSVTPVPTPTVRPSATPKPTPSPTGTPKPSPSPLSSSVPSPSPTVYSTPSPTAAPVVSTGNAAPAVYRTPALTIESPTLPSDMTQGAVFSLHGIIRSDCGSITSVTGTLFRGTGEVAQQTAYYPYSDYFSLAGTINNDLLFGVLTPDTYIYQVTAKAENGGAASEAILINHAFTVVKRSAPVSSGGSSGSYTEKLSSDTGNAALIWNFFINEFHNPYAAAAILGNIYTESSCDPMRVEGDLSGSFSQTYTAQVDSGAVSKSAFTDYTPGDKYGHGYGLCQWSAERKGALYDLAVSRGSSVGDLTTQCEFIMQELESEYTTLLEYLRTADDAEAAAFEFCTVYEKAAVHGGRTTFAKDYLDKYAA